MPCGQNLRLIFTAARKNTFGKMVTLMCQKDMLAEYGKQCKTPSWSTLFRKACMSKYLGLLQVSDKFNLAQDLQCFERLYLIKYQLFLSNIWHIN